MGEDERQFASYRAVFRAALLRHMPFVRDPDVMRALLVVALLVIGSAGASAATFPRTYDRAIKQAAELWLPGVPWKMWRAQLAAESRLDSEAVSPANAVGIAQFLEPTWLDVTREMGLGKVDRRMAAPAISAGAYYLAKQIHIWSAPRPFNDKIKLGQSSYNAGAGNLLQAQRLCGNSILFDEIMKCLPAVTGPKNFAETDSYVRRIWRYWREFEILL